MTLKPLFLICSFVTLLDLTRVTWAHASETLSNNYTLTALESADEIIIKSEYAETAPVSDFARSAPQKRHPSRLPALLPYRDEIQAVANALSMDPALIHAVIMVESGYRPRSVSPKGAYGLMQVIPATAKAFSAKPLAQMSDYEQIHVGSRYLKRMLTQFDGQLHLALAAYNAGPQAVMKYQSHIPPYAETQQYVPQVLDYYVRFQQQLARTSSPVRYRY